MSSTGADPGSARGAGATPVGSREVGRPGYTGPWDVAALQRLPEARTIASTGGIDAVLFAGEPYRGRPSRVFAYLGVPPAGAGAGPFPGVVCLHAGDGRAYRRWVARWIARGYAAIAVDLGGRGPDAVPLADGGPPLEFESLLGIGLETRDMWTYHAVAIAMLAHGLLAARPEVDPARIAVTGISWGAALACVAAGLDRRTACAMPVYGTGFLLDPSGIERSQIFAALSPRQQRRWHRRFDPAMYLPSCRRPILFLTGAADGGFPLDILQRSYRLVPGPVSLAVRREMDHCHDSGWSAPEVARFADHVLRGAPAPPRLGAIERDGRDVSAPVTAALPLRRCALLWTGDGGIWKERRWQRAPATLDGDRVRARLPPGTRVFFLAAEDTAPGGYASAPHRELPA